MIDLKFIQEIKQALVVSPERYHDDKEEFEERAKYSGKKLMVADEGGSFTSVFMKGGLAYKCTDEGNTDEFELSEIVCETEDNYNVYMKVHSDGVVLKEIGNEKFFPKLYFHDSEKYFSVSVVEEVKGKRLGESASDINTYKYSNWLYELIEWTLSKGWVPTDLSPRNIFVDVFGHFRCIDLNMFQRIETLDKEIREVSTMFGNEKCLWDIIGKDGENIISSNLKNLTGVIERDVA